MHNKCTDIGKALVFSEKKVAREVVEEYETNNARIYQVLVVKIETF